jgi:hypothetical protein
MVRSETALRASESKGGSIMASRIFTISAASALILTVFSLADEPAKAPRKADYADFSRQIQKIVAKQVPRFIQDSSGWGQTVPLPDRLAFPRLKRTTIRVGDRLELPHGLWRKFRVTIADPARDIGIQVRDFTQVNATTFRVKVDAQAAFRGEVEAQQWQKGLMLVGINADADATVGVALVCDVKVGFKSAKGSFIPDITLDPNVSDLKTSLPDFSLRRVSLKRAGVVLEGEQARDAGNLVKGYLEDLMRSFEPQIKDLANQAIARGLREGKGAFSPAELMKSLPVPAPK